MNRHRRVSHCNAFVKEVRYFHHLSLRINFKYIFTVLRIVIIIHSVISMASSALFNMMFFFFSLCDFIFVLCAREKKSFLSEKFCYMHVGVLVEGGFSYRDKNDFILASRYFYYSKKKVNMTFFVDNILCEWLYSQMVFLYSM